MTKILTPIIDYIEKNQEIFIQRLIEYLRNPSISAQNIGIQEVADILVKTLSNIGMEAHLIPTSKHPMVLGRWQKLPDKPTVILYGHYDVQPADPLDAWISPPFEPAIRDGRIYARGIGDNKGQHFAQILAIESHLAVHKSLPCNVIVLLEGEEEIGSPHIADFVQTNKDLLNADLVITADGHLHESGAPILEYGVRGVAAFELRAHGANRDVHSGNFGGVVPNPIWDLIHLLSSMKNDRGEITIQGFYDNVIPPTQLELEAVSRLPLDLDMIKTELGLNELDKPLERPYFDRLMFNPTFSINGFHGGYSGEGSKTIIPHEAFVKCDIRLVEAQTPEEVFQKIQNHVRKVAPDIEFIPGNHMLPSKTPMESSFAEPLRQAIRHVHGVDPLEIPSAGGSLPSYVFTKLLKLPSFVIPYANADEANHSPNENLTIDCFFSGIRTGAATLAFLGDM